MSDHSSEYAALLLEKRNKRKKRQQDKILNSTSIKSEPIIKEPEPIIKEPEPIIEIPEPIIEIPKEPEPIPNTNHTQYNTEDIMENNTQTNTNWRQHKTRNQTNRFNSNVNMRDFSAKEFYNTASSATQQATGIFSYLFGTIIGKIKKLANPVINPGGDHPNNTAQNPVNFDMNDLVIVGICVVGVALIFSDHSKEFDDQGKLIEQIQQIQQIQPPSLAKQLSHNPIVQDAIKRQGTENISFGERKILDHITLSANDNNKLVCELFLQTVKQTTGWWNDGALPKSGRSQQAYSNACNRLLNTEYNY